MAEIKIEQKKQIWPWLLLGVFIVAVITYYLMSYNNVEANTVDIVTQENYISVTNDTNLLGVKESNSTVAAFVSFVKNDTSKSSLNHAYTNEALIKLTAATNALAEEIGYDVGEDLNKVQESTSLIANESFETSQAINIRNATDNSTIALQNMQLAKYPWLSDEVEDLKSASTAINPSVTSIEQKDAVKNYFEKAADVLDKMN